MLDLTDEEIAAHVRAERDMKIAETDYLAMPDYPLSDGERVQVFAYRQALRDVPTPLTSQPKHTQPLSYIFSER